MTLLAALLDRLIPVEQAPTIGPITWEQAFDQVEFF